MEVNPLNLPEIVSIVLQKLPCNFLATRKVCKMWTVEANKLANSRLKIRIKSCDDLQRLTEFARSRIDFISSLSHFALDVEDDKNVDDFYTFFGPQITKLEFDLRYFPMQLDSLIARDFQRFSHLQNLQCLTLTVNCLDLIKGNFDIKLPKIKELEITIAEKSFINSQTVLQTKLVELMSSYPNVEIFTVKERMIKYHTYKIIAEDLANLPRNPCPKLRKMDFILNVNEEEVIKLQEFNFPLEYLRMSIRPGLRFPSLYTFLSKLGPSLTFLELDFVLVPPSQETFPCGPDLTNLKDLSLKNYFGPLDFLHYTKKLRTLSLTNVNLSVAFNFKDEEPLKKLRSLEIFSSKSNAGRFSFSHIFRKISKLFPELKRFRMDYLSDSNLQTICEGCPGLEELFLNNSVCTDEAVMGVTKAVGAELMEKVKKDEMIELERNPSISTLKDLKILHINAPRITDASLILGLSCCKKLKELCLSSPLITPAALKQTVRKLSLNSLRINHCYQIMAIAGSNDGDKSLTKKIFQHSENDGFPYPECKTGCEICGFPNVI